MTPILYWPTQLTPTLRWPTQMLWVMLTNPVESYVTLTNSTDSNTELTNPDDSYVMLTSPVDSSIELTNPIDSYVVVTNPTDSNIELTNAVDSYIELNNPVDSNIELTNPVDSYIELTNLVGSYTEVDQHHGAEMREEHSSPCFISTAEQTLHPVWPSLNSFLEETTSRQGFTHHCFGFPVGFSSAEVPSHMKKCKKLYQVIWRGEGIYQKIASASPLPWNGPIWEEPCSHKERGHNVLGKKWGTFGAFGSVSTVAWGRFTIFSSSPWGPRFFRGEFAIFWSSPRGPRLFGGRFAIFSSSPWGPWFLDGRFTLFCSSLQGPWLFGGKFTIFWSFPRGFGLHRHQEDKCTEPKCCLHGMSINHSYCFALIH